MPVGTGAGGRAFRVNAENFNLRGTGSVHQAGTTRTRMIMELELEPGPGAGEPERNLTIVRLIGTRYLINLTMIY